MLALCAALAAAAAGAQPAEVPDLPFAAFFRQPVGPRGLEISPALRAADGKRVRLSGFMVAQEEALPGQFLFASNPVRMSEHADGDADDLPPTTVLVLLDAAQRERIVAHRDGLLGLTGRLAVGRHEDPLSGRVSWVRLQLDADALDERQLAELPPAAAHRH